VAADPVGRGRGDVVAPGLRPPEPKPCGGVTPCFSRHCWKDDVCDELELEPEPEELPELEPHPARASTATVATALAAAGLRDRRIKVVSSRAA
jgi:hypothetical protein